jgi:hypothetical protein
MSHSMYQDVLEFDWGIDLNLSQHRTKDCVNPVDINFYKIKLGQINVCQTGLHYVRLGNGS